MSKRLAMLMLLGMLATAPPLRAEQPRPSEKPQSAPAVEPAELPVTSQEWFDRMRTLTRDMSPAKVAAAIGRLPDRVVKPRAGHIIWVYEYRRPSDKTTRSISIDFRDGHYVRW